MITVENVRAAAARIAPHVRRTPLVSARALKDNPYPDGQLLLKLECLQATGSFKARGATNKLLSLTAEEVRRGIITASGGNHGLATAYAGWLGKTKTTVYLPESASPEKAKKLADWGARVVFKGSVWDEANREAMAVAEREGLTYFHPFADPMVIAGQGTTALEILEQEPDVYEPLDLGFGVCRLVVAEPRELWERDDPARWSWVRVATKYPRLTEQYFSARGVQVEIVRLDGSIELAPLVGLAERIVDLVQSGETLRANGLVEVAEITRSTARLIVNRAAMKTEYAAISELIGALRRRSAPTSATRT